MSEHFRKLPLPLLILLTVTLVVAGCGDDGGGNNDDGDAVSDTNSDGTNPDGSDPDTTSDSEEDLPPGGCNHTGFTADLSEGTYSFAGSVRTAFLQTAGEPYNGVSIEIYSEDPMAATITLTDENYATCENCVRAVRQCTEEAGCAKEFLATEGELEITAIGVGGEQFAGVIRNVKMEEVTIDPMTFESTPVPNGEVWCIDELAFDVTAEGANPPETMCDSAQEALTVSEQTAVFDPGTDFGAALFYNGFSAEMAPRNWISMEIYTDAGGPSEPGTYDINYASYASCINCILVSTGCDAMNQCETTYLAVSGEMDITEFGEVGGGNFTATLRNVELFEHDVDFGTLESTPVEDGATFCIDELQITAPVTAP